MPIPPLVRSLRSALRVLPVEWVLWSIDADGVLLVHEGPGVRHRPGRRTVGRSVWEVYRGDRSILAFAYRVLREPAAAELTSHGLRFHIAGAPDAAGGAVGMAVVLGVADPDVPAPAPAALPSVLELLEAVPEIGGQAGDLLLWSPDRPDSVGFYREMPTSRLPEPVVRDLRVSRSSDADDFASPAPGPGGAVRPLRERAAHLRVVS